MVPTRTLPVTGLADPRPLALDRLVGSPLDEESAPVRVPLVDLLAAIRVRVAAEILVVDVAGGASIALSVHEVLASDDAHLLIDRLTAGVWLVDAPVGPVAPVVGVRALSFATFVGGRW